MLTAFAAVAALSLGQVTILVVDMHDQPIDSAEVLISSAMPLNANKIESGTTDSKGEYATRKVITHAGAHLWISCKRKNQRGNDSLSNIIHFTRPPEFPERVTVKIPNLERADWRRNNPGSSIVSNTVRPLVETQFRTCVPVHVGRPVIPFCQPCPTCSEFNR